MVSLTAAEISGKGRVENPSRGNSNDLELKSHLKLEPGCAGQVELRVLTLTVPAYELGADSGNRNHIP